MMRLFNFNVVKKPAVKRNRLNNKTKTSLQAGLLFVLSHSAFAATFNLPSTPTDSLIDNNKGQPLYVKASSEDSLIDIAVRYLLGQEEIVRANKKVDRWYPKAGTDVLIPTSYLLPDAPRTGIVINLPEYRLYYYPPTKNNSATSALPSTTAKKPPSLSAPSITPSNASSTPAPAMPSLAGKVISYAVGIGRLNWATPLGVTKVVGKTKNPTWTPPASIRAEHLAKGDVLPEVWKAGEDNPLGLFAFRLGIPGYLLHSTNLPQGVGMQVSHGCMRLYPKDIEKMFPIVDVGTQVNIVNQPIKVGWSKGQLYIEVHPQLDGEERNYQQNLDIALNLIEKASASRPVSVNGAILRVALEESNGLPTVISESDSQEPAATPLEPENTDSSRTLTAPSLTLPTDETVNDAAVPQSQIEKELEQEKIQEQNREFKNSSIPIN